MRQRAYLLQRYCALLAYIGELVAIIGVLYLLPLLLLPFYPGETAYAGGFIVAGAPLALVGRWLWLRFKPKEALSVNVTEAYVIVTAIWLVAVFAGSLPFASIGDMTFSQALFESTSGLTTTGMSLVNVAEAPRILLFFRSFQHWIGGAGFAIVAISAVGVLFGSGLSTAEGRSELLAPHVRNSARIVLRLYTSYAIFGILALRITGMTWFDAANHALSALSTGGFSTHADSLVRYDSFALEAVTVVLMMLGSISFVVAYMVVQGRLRLAARNGELRFMGVMWLISVLLVFSFVTVNRYPSVDRAIRVAIFETTSAMSGTGFSITDQRLWPDIGWLIMIVVMLMGGGSGSTAGGIKQFRLYILYKAIVWEIKRAFMPRHMVNEPAIWHGERRFLMHDHEVRQVALFVGLYLSVFLIGSGVFVAYGFPLKESLYEFASFIGNAGMTSGMTTPNLPAPLLWFMSLAMLLGRLEFLAIIVGILKISSDARTLLTSRE